MKGGKMGCQVITRLSEFNKTSHCGAQARADSCSVHSQRESILLFLGFHAACCEIGNPPACIMEPRKCFRGKLL